MCAVRVCVLRVPNKPGLNDNRHGLQASLKTICILIKAIIKDNKKVANTPFRSVDFRFAYGDSRSR